MGTLSVSGALVALHNDDTATTAQAAAGMVKHWHHYSLNFLVPKHQEPFKEPRTLTYNGAGALTVHTTPAAAKAVPSSSLLQHQLMEVSTSHLCGES